MVSDVTISTAVGNQQKTSLAGATLAKDFTQFLTLLTTQLQNQDPLAPMDSTEFTNQLVAFTGVEQQINSNQKLDNLIALQLGNAMGSALSYVGMDASYVSSELSFDGSTPSTIRFALDGQATQAKLRIIDEHGDTVFETDVEKSVGKHEFVWDGKTDTGATADPGTYSIRIDALDANQQGINSTVVVTGRVRGVETQNGLIHLLVGERAISLGNIINVSVPNETTEAEPETENTET